MEAFLAILVVVIIAAIFVGIFAAVVWPGYLLSGRISVQTNWSPREVGDSLESYFVPSGWQVRHRASDFLVLGRGPSGCSALLYLVIFFPVGLVYLLTDWGRARLAARFSRDEGAKTQVELEWRNAAIRREISKILEGLAKD